MNSWKIEIYFSVATLKVTMGKHVKSSVMFYGGKLKRMREKHGVTVGLRS